jgi:hypothetical protein
MLQQPDLRRDGLDTRPDLAAFGEEVVEGIDQHCRATGVIGLGHDFSSALDDA